MQFARDVCQALVDQLLRAVGRAGVDDDPRVDGGSYRGEAALDDTRLVLDDHVQADSWMHPPGYSFRKAGRVGESGQGEHTHHIGATGAATTTLFGAGLFAGSSGEAGCGQ